MADGELKLYELQLAEPGRLFSPACWKVRLALGHKGLPFKSVPAKYHQREQWRVPGMAPDAKPTVPVLEHKETRLRESDDIVRYLDQQWPDKPQLLTPADPMLTFGLGWVGPAIQACVFRLSICDIWAHLDPKDQPYIRESREAWVKQTLEEYTGDQQERIKELQKALQPVRAAVTKFDYLGGSSPNYIDIAVLANLLWAMAAVKAPLLEQSDPVFAWRQRCMKHYDSVIKDTVHYL